MKPAVRLLQICLALMAVVMAAGVFAMPAFGADGPPRPDASSWILIDAGDGAVLAEHEADRRSPIASTTKIMTARVAIADLERKRTVTVGGYNGSPVESLMGLAAGDTVTVQDLLYGLMLPSGNDAAVALAEAASGSVGRFVERMNEEARALGLENTSYANPIGLDDPDNYSTARDLATLAIVMRDNKFFSKIVDTPAYSATAGGRQLDLVNRNNLVVDTPWVDGVKTGRTETAGNILVASGEQDDVALVAVVLGAPDEQARDAGARLLLEYGFGLYRPQTVVTRGEQLGRVPVAYREEELNLLARRKLKLSMRDDQEARVELLDVPDEVRSAEAGEKLGKAVVTVGDERRGTVAVVAATTFAPPTLMDKVDSFLPGPGPIVWLVVIVAVLVILLLATSRSRRTPPPRPSRRPPARRVR